MDLKKALNIAAEILVTTAIILAAFYAGRAWPGGEKSKLTLNTNPGANARNQIIERVTGHGTGHINEKPWMPKPTSASSQIQDGKRPEATPLPPATPWSAAVPISGEVTAKFTDKKNGRELGSETKPLSGMALVTGNETGLSVDTKFDSEFNFAVDVPEPGPKPFHLGAMLTLDPKISSDFGGYVQYDFLLRQGKKINVLAPVRVELLPDGWHGMVGIEVGF